MSAVNLRSGLGRRLEILFVKVKIFRFNVYVFDVKLAIGNLLLFCLVDYFVVI